MFAGAAVTASMHATSDAFVRRHSFAERALAEMLAEPRPFWQGSEDREPVWLLFVSLGSLQLAPNLGNARFQVRIRYGGHGRFREKYSQKVKSTPPVDCQGQPSSLQGMLVMLERLENSPELNGTLGVCESFDQQRGRWVVRLMSNEAKAIQEHNLIPACQVFANVDSLFVFPWSRDLTPHITFSLRKLGFYDTTISEATVHIPFVEGRPGITEQELLFLGKRGASGFVGQLGILAELRSFPRGDLLQGPSFPGALEEMLGSLELLRMPPGHLGPNSMAGRPVRGTPLDPGEGTRQHWWHREEDTATHARAASNAPVVNMGMPAGVSPGTLPVDAPDLAGGFAGDSGGTPVVMGRPLPGSHWSLR